MQIRINNVETEKQKAEDMEAKRLLEEKRAAEEAERNAEADRASRQTQLGSVVLQVKSISCTAT